MPKRDPAFDPDSQMLFEVCGMPAFLGPWIHRFYESGEIEILRWLTSGPLTPESLHRRVNAEQASIADWRKHLDRAGKRGVIDTTPDGRLVPAAFWARFEIWALFEGWQDIPERVREKLRAWEAERYAGGHQQRIEDLKQGRGRETAHPYPEIVLLHEVDAVLERVEHIYLWPCNCRAIAAVCNHERLTCIRFDNDRNIGWEVSLERAREIIHRANREGLVQSAELAIGNDGRLFGAICNCCRCCCFPHRLGSDLDATSDWPLVRYRARIHPERCNACGRCGARCPFDAIDMETAAEGRRRRPSNLRTERCRGCGLCMTGCPTGAIEMVQIRESVLEPLYRPVSSDPPNP